MLGERRMNHDNNKGEHSKRQYFQKAGLPWELQTAQTRFSELFRLALTEGPQLILSQNKDGVVMLPVEQFNLLVSRAH
jgi:hypothetical protein